MCLYAGPCEHVVPNAKLCTNMHVSSGSRRKSSGEKVNEGFETTGRYLRPGAGVCGGERWQGSRETSGRMHRPGTAYSMDQESWSEFRHAWIICYLGKRGRCRKWPTSRKLDSCTGRAAWRLYESAQVRRSESLYKTEDAFNDTGLVWLTQMHIIIIIIITCP